MVIGTSCARCSIFCEVTMIVVLLAGWSAAATSCAISGAGTRAMEASKVLRRAGNVMEGPCRWIGLQRA
jgi:hypothetical protein